MVTGRFGAVSSPRNVSPQDVSPLDVFNNSCIGATKHRIGYIGHIRVQIMLLLDMTQYKVVKGKRLGSVLVLFKQFSLAQPRWGLGRVSAPPQNIIRLRCIRCGVLSHPFLHAWHFGGS